MIGLVVGGHLLQIILTRVKIVLLAGSSDPSAEREIHGTENFRGRICLVDHCGVLLAEGNDRVVVRLIGFYVTVRVAPASWLIIQLVVRNAAVCGGAERCNEMLHPTLLQRDGVIDMVGINIVVNELGSTRCETVAAAVAIGVNVGIGGLLRA